MRYLSRPIRRHELFELIEGGEGIDVEFKRQFSSPEKIAREMIALANTRGGYILFGVDDDRSIRGVHSEKAELGQIEHAAMFYAEPPLTIEAEHVHAGGGRYVVLVRVPESTQKPHVLVEYDASGRRAKTQTNQGFVRVGEHSVHASKEVMSVMRSESPDSPPLRLSIGPNERALFEYLDRHDRITLKQFADLVNISDRRASRILVALVRSGNLLIHTMEREEFYTLA